MIFSAILGIISFLSIIIFLFFSDVYILETKNSLLYFFNNVFPIIFPFYVLSSIIINGNLLLKASNKLKNIFPKTFNLPSCSIIVLVAGIISGYPSGAKIAADLKNTGNLSRNDAALLCSFTNNIGPIFTILVVGKKYLSNPLDGLKIWFCVTISSLIIGYVLCKTANKDESCINNSSLISENHKINISTAILNGLNTALYVGAVIVFFSSITVLIKVIPCITEFHESLFHTILELTGGMKKMNKFIVNSNFKKQIFCSLCSWTGLSSHMQIYGIMKANDIPCKYFTIMKLIQPIIALCLLHILP